MGEGLLIVICMISTFNMIPNIFLRIDGFQSVIMSNTFTRLFVSCSLLVPSYFSIALVLLALSWFFKIKFALSFFVGKGRLSV